LNAIRKNGNFIVFLDAFISACYDTITLTDKELQLQINPGDSCHFYYNPATVEKQ